MPIFRKIKRANQKQTVMSCEPLNELPPRKDEYEDAVVDLHFLYDLLRCEGHDPESSFMKGIKYAHDYLDDKPR
jgi:SPX domain protein involved in polyphosphate accumulation